MNQARTIVEKVWGAHVVAKTPGRPPPTLLYIDLHLVHESPRRRRSTACAGAA